MCACLYHMFVFYHAAFNCELIIYKRIALSLQSLLLLTEHVTKMILLALDDSRPDILMLRLINDITLMLFTLLMQ